MPADDKPLLQKDLEEVLSKLGHRSAESRWHAWIDIGLKTFIAAAAALGTYYLSVQKQESDEKHVNQVQTNDDVRLVVELVDANPTRRSIGIAIAKAYAGADRIPVQVYEAINAFAVSTNTLSQSSETNAVTAQIPVSVGVAPTFTGLQSSKSLPIRIYIQYQRPEDEGAMLAIRQSLNGAAVADSTLLVPPIEHVRSTIAQPILKCFRKAECDKYGNALVDQMKASGAPSNLTLQYINGFETSTAIREKHFEAWIGPLAPHPPK